MRYALLITIIVPVFACDPASKDGPASPKAGANKIFENKLPNRIKLTPQAIKRSNITFAKVQKQMLIGGLMVPAEIKLDHHRTAHVTAIVSGQIKKLHSVRGSVVKVGQPMALLHSVALGQARASISAARAQYQQAKATFERQQRLRKEGIGALKHFLAAKSARAQARAQLAAAQSRLGVYGSGGRGSVTLLKAPVNGEVIQCHANLGEMVKPGEHLFVISDLSRVWMVGQVYEQDVDKVRKGLPARVSLQAYPNRVFLGRVDYVSATLDEKTRTLPIRVELKNEKRILKPGMFGKIDLTPKHSADKKVLTLPVGALQRLRGHMVVFSPTKKSGEFQVKTVVVGRRVGQTAEIVSGIKVGDSIAQSGTFTLKSELLRSELAED